MESKDYKITPEQVDQWGNCALSNHHLSWFADVLNGDWKGGVEDARASCLSIVDDKQYEKENSDKE